MLESSSSDPLRRHPNHRARTNKWRNFRGGVPQEGDHVEKPNISGNETGEKAGGSNSRVAGVLGQANKTDKVYKASENETSVSGCMAMNGCSSNNETARFMNERWEAALRLRNDTSLDIADRPVVYCSSEGNTVWGSSKVSYPAPVGPVGDFISEAGNAARQSQH